MEFDFETLVERSGANLKLMMTPPEVVKAGNISLDGAEPDFKSAPVIEEAVIRFAKNGLYGFTLPDEAYKSAVTKWMQMSRKTQIKPEWIVTTLGTIYSLATTIRLVCTDPDDGIIVTTPVYNRYRQAADRLNKRTVECQLIYDSVNGSYQMDFDAISSAMANPNNKLFVLCNPHNPIGQIWKEKDLVRLAELANRYDVIVYSDEIFADNCYQGLTCPCYLDIKGAKSHAIVATGLGKSFGFTGVNHANIIIADDELRARFTDRRTRDHYGSLDPCVYECVLSAYTKDGKAWVDASNAYVWENMCVLRDYFAKHLPKARVCGGEGAYILWIDWSAYFSSGDELNEFLVKKAHVCLGEGSDYDSPLFTRVCMATPRKCLIKTLESIGEAFSKLGKEK